MVMIVGSDPWSRSASEKARLNLVHINVFVCSLTTTFCEAKRKHLFRRFLFRKK